MSDPGVQRRVLNWGRIALVIAAVVALVAVVFGVRAVSAPVEKAGAPTIAVPAPSGTRFTSPSPTPSATGTAMMKVMPTTHGTSTLACSFSGVARTTTMPMPNRTPCTIM